MPATSFSWYATPEQDHVLVFTDYPSLMAGKVLYSDRSDKAAQPVFHFVSVDPEARNEFGDMRCTVPTARLTTMLQFAHPGAIMFNGRGYDLQPEPFDGDIVMFDRNTADRSMYGGYACEYLLKRQFDGLLVLVLAPERATLDDYVVFVGAQYDALYEVPQYHRPRLVSATHAELYVVLDQNFADKIELPVLPGPLAIYTGDRSWLYIGQGGLDITFSDDHRKVALGGM